MAAAPHHRFTPPVSPPDGEDCISHLPDELLTSVVTRLPLKDAARTAVLSPRSLRIATSDVNGGDIISRIRRSSYPAEGEDSISQLPDGEDRISQLPDELLASVVKRLPLKDAARTAVLSPRWRHILTFSFAISDVNGGEDRISRLPDKLLSNIVSRLPLKDAARTSVLSPRLRRVWASTPLVLHDADLFPVLSDKEGVPRWRTITNAISCILAVHQGPFRSIRLSFSFHYAVAHDAALARRWLQILADKGVQILELFNHPGSPFSSTSTNLPILPSEVFSVASLGRLNLRYWEFPSTDCFCPGVNVFPCLREIRLTGILIRNVDIDRLLQYSPKLEMFSLIASDSDECSPSKVFIRSRSLQCAVFWMSIANTFHVICVPYLKRLIFKKPNGQSPHDSSIRINIGYTPNLKVLGYLDPRIHVLEIHNIVIEAETGPKPSSVIPSVGILALDVRFDVLKEAKMVPSFLRCFPCIDTLHLQSGGADEPIDLKFWEEVSPIRCLQLTLRKVVFRNLRGYDSEFAFLKFIWKKAKVLQKLVVDLACGDDPALIEEVVTKLKSQVCAKRVWKERKSRLVLRSGGSKWSFNVASNLTLSDPFDF